MTRRRRRSFENDGATFFVVVAIALGAFVPRSVHAGPKRRSDFPCPGCLTDVPDPVDALKKAPLLVVLHGDGQGAIAIAPLFAKEAAARGIVLFLPKCPKADGCTDARWWAWGRDPSWFDAQIAAIEAVQPLDHDRLWLAGWSGGSSYIGEVAPALAGRFAAVSINGGGMAPTDRTCPTTCSLPAYFMVGDANPLHALAKDLRAWFDDCQQEVVWDLQKGKDHGGELLVLSKAEKVATILDWLALHPKTCATAPTTTSVSSAADSMDARVPTASASTSALPIGPTVSSTSTTPPPSTTPGRCGCAMAPPLSPSEILASVLVLGSAFVRRRWFRAKQRR